MTREEYTRKVARRGRLGRLALAVLPLLCLLTALGLFGLVWAGPSVGIPGLARDYMLMTGPFDFSQNELRRLVAASSASSVGPTELLLVYWAYFASSTLAGLLLLLAPLFRRFGVLRQEPWERGLIETERLEAGLRRFRDSPSFGSKLALLRIVYRPRLYSLISPLRKGWYKQPQHQWLEISALEPGVRPIFASLKQLDESLFRAVTLDVSLDRFIEGVRLLCDFFFSVASRRDPVLRKPLPPARDSHVYEREILSRFAAVVRPGILEVCRAARNRQRPWRIVTFTSEILRARIVRGAATISSVAAGVMILGVVLFDIPRPQAFLTWFTVTFGSLTISVGIESFRISRDPERADKDAEQ